jgi:hypothetical protein
MMVSEGLIKYVTLKIEGEPATHTKSPKAENPVRRGVALANVAAPLISDLILKEPALPAAHSRCPVRASRRMAASPVLHPSFDTLAEFIIGPRFARTRWQAPPAITAEPLRGDEVRICLQAPGSGFLASSREGASSHEGSSSYIALQ